MKAAPSGAGRALRVGLLAVGSGVVALGAMRVGAAPASWLSAWNDPTSFDGAVLGARSARVVLGYVGGAGLAVVGASYQCLFRNPLGDPYALGVSGGAALGATLAVLFGAGMAAVPAAAFVGALAAMGAVLLTARATGRVGAEGMLLAGLVSNAISSAGLAFLRSTVHTGRSQETLSILLGAIAEEPWPRVTLVAAAVLVGTLLLMALSKAMNLLAHGEDTAASLGVEVGRAELGIFLVGSGIVAAVVSVCGLVPFVGLMVPHYVRGWVGSDHRALLPGSFFAGGALLVAADAATRAMFGVFGSEPPVGALTALVGGPFFLVMLRQLGAPRR